MGPEAAVVSLDLWGRRGRGVKLIHDMFIRYVYSTLVPLRERCCEYESWKWDNTAAMFASVGGILLVYSDVLGGEVLGGGM